MLTKIRKKFQKMKNIEQFFNLLKTNSWIKNEQLTLLKTIVSTKNYTIAFFKENTYIDIVIVLKNKLLREIMVIYIDHISKKITWTQNE